MSLKVICWKREVKTRAEQRYFLVLLMEFLSSLPPNRPFVIARERQMSVHRQRVVAFSNFPCYHGHLPNIQFLLEAFEPRTSPDPCTAAVVPCSLRKIKPFGQRGLRKRSVAEVAGGLVEGS